MRVLMFSTWDTRYGASRAAYRIFDGLRRAGADVRMLSLVRDSDDPDVLTPPQPEPQTLERHYRRWERRTLRFYADRPRTVWSSNWRPNRVMAAYHELHASGFEPDIINLQWIGSGFLPVHTLRPFQAPIVWTLQDCWAYTGGCHYPGTCTGYQQQCGNCPQLASRRAWDLSRMNWRNKQYHWRSLDMTLVGTSHWIAGQARNSSLLGHCPTQVIPNGLDTQKFSPTPVDEARRALDLPQDRRLIVFGASGGTDDPRKGFQHVIAALKQLAPDWADKAELLVFGGGEVADSAGFRVHNLGVVNDDTKLAQVYSAADVMLVPSVEEAFGQTASEALACATPVVAFDATGPRDIIAHQQTGYLARSFDPIDLVQGINWVLSDLERHAEMRVASRERAVTLFSIEQVAAQYLALFETMLHERGKRS